MKLQGERDAYARVLQTRDEIIKDLRTENAKLREYIRHKRDCVTFNSPYADGECDCGYFELVKSLS